MEAPVASQRQSPVSAEEQPEQQQPHGASHFQAQQRDPPSVSASQPSPSLSPSSSILGGSAGSSQRRGGPTSLPPASSHSTEPVSPATPFQQQPYAAVGTPDQSVVILMWLFFGNGAIAFLGVPVRFLCSCSVNF